MPAFIQGESAGHDQTNQLDPLKGPDPTCEPEAPGPGTSWPLALSSGGGAPDRDGLI